jgi:hypothetical protein
MFLADSNKAPDPKQIGYGAGPSRPDVPAACDFDFRFGFRCKQKTREPKFAGF